MGLSGPIVAIVLFGALLHASWNAIVKSSSDSVLDTALIHILVSLLAVPVVWWVGWPPQAAWPYIAASVTIHIAYYVALTQAYRHGDMSLTYPLMRGTAPLLVALGAGVALGEHLSLWAWVGIGAISAGVLTLGLTSHALESRQAVAFALANAVVIAIYTVVDGQGARVTLQAGASVSQYVATMFMLDGWPFGLWVAWRRRAAAWQYARARWPVATLGALGSLGSYAIALWAMTQAPVAAVAALRETSVLFAAFIGAWFLGERLTLRRLAGTGVILAGVLTLRLAG